MVSAQPKIKAIALVTCIKTSVARRPTTDISVNAEPRPISTTSDDIHHASYCVTAANRTLRSTNDFDAFYVNGAHGAPAKFVTLRGVIGFDTIDGDQQMISL